MNTYHVNILGFDKVPSHLTAISFIVERMKKRSSEKALYVPHVYFCDKENPNDVRNTINANKIAEGDLTISIGLAMTKEVHIISNDIGGLPTLFVGIPDPVGLGVIKSLEKPGGYMSGIIVEKPSATKFSEAIKDLHPHVTRMLIIYDPTSFDGFYNEHNLSLFRKLKKIGFKLEIHKSTSPDEARTVLINKIKDVEAVLLLEGCSIASLIGLETSYISAHTERFFIGNFGANGISAGAPISYGCEDDVFSDLLMDKVETYLEKRKPLGATPVTVITNCRRLYINKFMLPWMPRPMFKKLVENPDSIVMSRWIDCPLKIDSKKERTPDEITHT